jgi:hypothetical protein
MQLHMRVDKTTRNADDFRVLMAGAIVAIIIMLVQPLTVKFWDGFVAGRPFVTATVEVVFDESSQSVKVLYDADAKQATDAIWIGTIQTEEGDRIFTRRGTGAYSTKVDNPRLWLWSAFWDNEKGLEDPEIPNEAFKICLRYISTARRSGILDETPEMCSNTFYLKAIDQ